jgi:predicted DNA-binding protein (UPF0251 family)
MPRPPLPRQVLDLPRAAYFKPQGAPLRELEEILLPIEGLEALRLADLEGLTAEEAAAHMGVSRHTFGRVLAAARAAVARALVEGAALRIAGGHYAVAGAAGACGPRRCGRGHGKGRGGRRCGQDNSPGQDGGDAPDVESPEPETAS